MISKDVHRSCGKALEEVDLASHHNPQSFLHLLLPPNTDTSTIPLITTSKKLYILFFHVKWQDISKDSGSIIREVQSLQSDCRQTGIIMAKTRSSWLPQSTEYTTWRFCEESGSRSPIDRSIFVLEFIHSPHISFLYLTLLLLLFCSPIEKSIFIRFPNHHHFITKIAVSALFDTAYRQQSTRFTVQVWPAILALETP